MSFHLPQKPADETWKQVYEGSDNNTYGIEIEFGTHSDVRLSFSHIEVCRVRVTDGENHADWVFETDADNTLELVSPILTFETEEHARYARDELVAGLYWRTMEGKTLEEFAQSLIQEIVGYFAVGPGGVCRYVDGGGQPHTSVQTLYISRDDLVADINDNNADLDVDIERGVAARRALQRLGVDADAALRGMLSQVVLTTPRKHGGLPASQMNIPLTLSSYVRYMVERKRQHAWERVVDRVNQPVNQSPPNLVDDEAARTLHKIDALRATYLTDPWDEEEQVFAMKYLNSDYAEASRDQNMAFWHRYWLWSETFAIAPYVIRRNHDGDPQQDAIDAVLQTTPSDYPDWDRVLTTFWGLHFDTQDDENVNADQYQPLYLLLQKAVFGSLAILSEGPQLALQTRLMNAGGAMSAAALKASVKDPEFLSFHYALKDLTSLWFKGALVDVLTAQGTNLYAQTAAIRTYDEDRADRAAGLITTVLHNRLRLLGWFHGMCATLSRPLPYDWDEFVAYNVPNVELLKQTLVRVFAEMSALGADQQYICRYAPDNVLPFLQRRRVGDPPNQIAPWEGRWDTIKPVIPGAEDDAAKFLVEHRNN